jgi:2-polyprenyl-3-methyl-5-hydroxy-6-metoxy-1,4-benzoquinol methylase
MKEKQKPAGLENRRLQNQIALGQLHLYDKLANLDINSLNISEYNQRYLASKTSGLKRVLQLYGRLLYLSLNNSQISPENFVLVDYGGGSGLISFLAAEMGIGTVIYNDIYDVSCKDVRTLSNALELKVDHVVCGDVDELVSYLHGNSISINAITSYDVLEHIYDVEYHFRKLACLKKSQFRILYASGANINNPRYVRSVKKKQIVAEYEAKDKKRGYKERDTFQAFLDVRRDMISAYAPDLSTGVVEQLARSTRGLIQRDIERCVDEFRQRGSLSYHIDHPTNTCDPYTGNWCEHLMDFEWLKKIVKNAGFSVEIMPGRYNTDRLSAKNIVKLFLNVMIQLLGRRCMFLAPYYVVCADVAEQTMD